MHERKKKSGNKSDNSQKILLVAAILNLVRAVVDLINELTG